MRGAPVGPNRASPAPRFRVAMGAHSPQLRCLGQLGPVAVPVQGRLVARFASPLRAASRPFGTRSKTAIAAQIDLVPVRLETPLGHEQRQRLLSPPRCLKRRVGKKTPTLLMLESS